jgi:hypothetical protein
MPGAHKWLRANDVIAYYEGKLAEGDLRGVMSVPGQ